MIGEHFERTRDYQLRSWGVLLRSSRYAILLDGGFVRMKLREQLKRQPTAADVVAKCNALRSITHVDGHELLRIYYYDARPLAHTLKRPVSQTEYTSEEAGFAQKVRFFEELALKPDFALRMGQLSLAASGWRLKPTVPNKLLKEPRPLKDDDFIIAVQQKGVDMRVGMDMARLALRQMVDQVIVVTADTDFVPAFKFVRREGLRVILGSMGQDGSRELRQHSDVVL